MKLLTCVLFFLISTVNLSFADMNIKNAYQFSFTRIDGKPLNLIDFQGKVILIVNTASNCGLSSQYIALENLYQQYKDRGLVVIAVPSSDFGGQELKTEKEVKSFVDEKFKITFPITTISKVKGKGAVGFYKWANEKAGILGSPKWNFHKYLIDRNGNFAGWFASTTKPESKKLVNAIEELLNQN
jgi:glutathione peroxidase